MTREEAIDGLKVVRTIHNGNYAPQIDEAIKALEQEPILDKIRAEIEQIARPYELGCRGNRKSIRYGLCVALEIIDKYIAIAESEKE